MFIIITIRLNNGFYYKGEILEENERYLILKDVKNKEVTISKDAIMTREVDL